MAVLPGLYFGGFLLKPPMGASGDFSRPGRSAARSVALQTRGPSKHRTRKVPDQRCTANALHRIRDTPHITFFDRPQPLSAVQMPRSSRKRSIGADDLIELIR